MGVLMSVSTVFFVILCILLVIIILLQSDKSSGMGILGGSSQSTFGSSTADVITKISAVMVTIFMLGSLGLAILKSNNAEALKKKVFSKDSSKTSIMDKQKKVETKNKTAETAGKTKKDVKKETKTNQ